MNLFEKFKAQVNKKEPKPVLAEIEAKIKELEEKLRKLREQFNVIYEGNMKNRQISPEQEKLMQEIQCFDVKLIQLRKAKEHLISNYF